MAKKRNATKQSDKQEDKKTPRRFEDLNDEEKARALSKLRTILANMLIEKNSSTEQTDKPVTEQDEIDALRSLWGDEE